MWLIAARQTVAFNYILMLLRMTVFHQCSRHSREGGNPKPIESESAHSNMREIGTIL
jgi:hypothetical protein